MTLRHMVMDARPNGMLASSCATTNPTVLHREAYCLGACPAYSRYDAADLSEVCPIRLPLSRSPAIDLCTNIVRFLVLLH